MRAITALTIIAAGATLSGCAWILPDESHGSRPALMWIQSILVTAGPTGNAIGTLSWVMFAGAAAILLLVVGFTAYAIFGGRRTWMTNPHFVIAFGVAMPVLVLSILLLYGLSLTARSAAREQPALRIEVVGERWWWRVHYLGADGAHQFVTANEIAIPTGVPVEFILKTSDVIHSFWVPSLAGKLDMIPGRINRYQFSAARPGIYRGQCAEYCGAQHALMAFYVVAMEPDRFRTWLENHEMPASEPATALGTKGKELFIAAGCGACHTIRGTAASGLIGPDLTHFGGRRSVAAGSFPNNAGTIAGWIVSSQHLKPGNLMPSFVNLRGEDLRAVAAYLEGLK
ncbi:cytochrome c oxidase subunit II [Bradyrhizobium sp. LHD-71]|uniref:cytochrome c oxidase subunit II n=1 Tax=Bradyrhizobium sp. LHD-71 TaxID=3072141 RepID=UPI00280EB377|nr:cytochrome c oxidase subunit II [Bradyrhizobium sp. LHD-71]MDQ8732166.1 cytochrome c oxidase subunit II [Bradyrhizobium sp. LHD-71]